MHKNVYSLYALIVLLFCSTSAFGQRKTELMDRAVVAIPKSSGQMYISWRYFATDPDSIGFNIYYRTSANGISFGAETKVNTTPVTNSTNFTATMNTTSFYYNFYVKSVIKGVEAEEPGDFTVPKGKTSFSRIVKDFDYAPLPAGHPKMMMKFCWVGDLNGDGKYDFVIDRHGSGLTDDQESETGTAATTVTPKIEAYTSEGEFLWRIDIGVNVITSSGHNDMVTAYDMDGDGKAEVLLAVGEGTTFPDGTVITAADGTVTDYNNLPGSAPQWIAIVNGETGNLVDTIALPVFNEIATTRTDRWKHIAGHFIIAHLDGIKPSLIYQYKNRQASGSFSGVHSAYSYVNGALRLEWANLSTPEQGDFHQVRVADVDGDGYDEFVEGGFVIDNDGSELYRAPNVAHGDRHVLADIDPDRPGLEHFFIQQTNIMGMGYFDAATGEMIKSFYMPAVADVGRGSCAAFVPGKRGLQFFSTMYNYQMYDGKGNIIPNTFGMFPAEAIWWGPDLNRWLASPIGSSGHNIAFNKINSAGTGFERVLPNFYNEGGSYYLMAYGAGRPAFWGDILGDWREEMVLARRDSTGFAVVSTWDETSHRIYCLMQNPAYRCQTTAKGYYQSPDVDYYMASDMPQPPVAPVQKADLYYTASAWINDDNNADTYVDGKSIMFDVRGGNSTYNVADNMSPGRLWLMNPKGSDYNFTGSGKFTGDMDLIKSMQGDVILNGNHDYTGLTRISEGRLFVNGTLVSPVVLNARGVIGGNAVLNGGIALETGLNVEGGRIEPGNGSALGTITITGDLFLPGRNNLVFDIDQTQALKNDSLKIRGDFLVTGINHTLIINQLTDVQPGILTLITFTGTTDAAADNFTVRGLDGIPYQLLFDANAVKIEIFESRAPATVAWTGSHSTVWDFQTPNFMRDGVETIFVPGDTVLFNDNAVNKTITINETMPVGGLVFTNEADYLFNGSGLISGEGKLLKTGKGKVSILLSENTFTGSVDFSDGILEVSSLKDGGLPSSIGASSSDAGNWMMRDASLQTTAQMATNRNMQLQGKLTVNNPATNMSVLISGNIQGSGTSLEVTGKGTLTLQGNNSFAAVNVKDGLLLLGSADANRYSVGNAKITLSGGIFRMHDINSTGNTGTFTNDIEVPGDVSARWELPSRWGIAGKLTGSGTVTVNAPYVRTDLNGDWSEFTGTINFTGRDIRLNNTAARNIANATVNLGTDTYLYAASNGSGESSSAYTITFGALSGSGGIAGKNSLIIGGNNRNSVYSGVIGSGGGRLTKRGTGILTLSGGNLYTGGTQVDAGKLFLANTEGSATGTGTVTVKNNAGISGAGTIGGILLVETGALVEPGDESASSWTGKLGTLTLEKNFLMNGKLKMEVRNVSGYVSDKLTVKGNTSIGGELTVEIVAGNDAFPLGAEITLFNFIGAVSGQFSGIILPPTVGAASWDTGELLTTGKIKVVSASGNNKPHAGSAVKVYPNPASDYILVDLPPAQTYRIKIIDLSGKIILSRDLAAGEKINIDTLPEGFYVVNYTKGTDRGFTKFIKTH